MDDSEYKNGEHKLIISDGTYRYSFSSSKDCFMNFAKKSHSATNRDGVLQTP